MQGKSCRHFAVAAISVEELQTQSFFFKWREKKLNQKLPVKIETQKQLREICFVGLDVFNCCKHILQQAHTSLVFFKMHIPNTLQTE